MATCGQQPHTPPAVAHDVGGVALQPGVKASAAPGSGRPAAAAAPRSAATSATFFANFSAASFASVPELQRKALVKWRVDSTSSFASSSGSHVCTMFDVCCTLSACAASTRATPASECPSAFTAMPAKKSRYARPSAVKRRDPSPRVKTSPRATRTASDE